MALTVHTTQALEVSRTAVILIAEDNDGHASLMKRKLKRCGLAQAYHRFRDGQEVLDFLVKVSKSTHLQPLAPHILFLDGCMPKMTGQEVLRKIQANHILQTIPLTIITTTDDAQERESFKALGCTSHLKKPVEIQALRQIFIHWPPDNPSPT